MTSRKRTDHTGSSSVFGAEMARSTFTVLLATWLSRAYRCRRPMSNCLPFGRIVTLLALLGFGACNSSPTAHRQAPTPEGEKKAPLVLFAAASTTDLMQRVATAYEKRFGTEVRLSFASSGQLARQLNAGASADLFVSASPQWMNFAESRGLLEQSTEFLQNRLALVTPIDSSLEPVVLRPGLALPRSFKGRLSLGDPSHVPAGRYAQEALQWLRWATPLKNRLLLAHSVRAVLRVVELGEVDLGIVYETDAQRSPKVRTIGRFPSGSHGTIAYCVGLVKDRPKAARSFYEYLLKSTDANRLYSEMGFVPKGG